MSILILIVACWISAAIGFFTAALLAAQKLESREPQGWRYPE